MDASLKQLHYNVVNWHYSDTGLLEVKCFLRGSRRITDIL